MLDTDTPLPGLLPEFASEGWTIPETVTHHVVWKAVVNGRLPARKVGTRYIVAAGDKPAYAKLLGLVPPIPKPPRKAASVSAAA